MLKKFINILPISLLVKLLPILIQILNKKGNMFVTYQQRPQNALNIRYNTNGLSYENFAIVIQGPLVEEKNFTLETVKLYLSNFNKVTIIISTWLDANSILCSKLEALGVIVIKNSKPQYAGNQNINLQIKSTYSGILKANELGKLFVAKTRSDQRIYNPFFLQCVKSLEHYSDDFVHGLGLKSRLIISSMSTLINRPYGATDMLMLGYTEDLLYYWNTDEDLRATIDLSNIKTVEHYAALQLAETYILSNFIKRNGGKIDFSLKTTWYLYQNLFIVHDKTSFNIFWYKYSFEKENRLDYYEEHIYNELSHFEWSSLESREVPEYLLKNDLIPYKP